MLSGSDKDRVCGPFLLLKPNLYKTFLPAVELSEGLDGCCRACHRPKPEPSPILLIIVFSLAPKETRGASDNDA